MSNNVYSTDHSSSVLRTHTWRTASNSAGYLLPYIKPSMKILDIGCGPGSITIDFAKRVPSGSVIGVEYVADPLDGARALAEQEGVKNVTFQTADIHSLPFDDNSFDIVHVHQVLQHIADPIKALTEMRRVAKQGGIVAARESQTLTWSPPSVGLDKWLDLTVRIAREKGGNPHPGARIHVWARDAGFDMERIQRSASAWCFSSPEERQYWGGSMGERVKDSGLAKKA
ncbi:UbiE COQ5 methyltransferase, partial [Aspergillus sclerotialis]